MRRSASCDISALYGTPLTSLPPGCSREESLSMGNADYRMRRAIAHFGISVSILFPISLAPSLRTFARCRMGGTQCLMFTAYRKRCLLIHMARQ